MKLLGLLLALCTVPFAPVDRAGPPLSISAAEVREAVVCSPDAAGAGREVALFVPATALGPEEFDWNWFPALDALGYPYCSVRLPGYALGDIQETSEYVTGAIRLVHRISGRKIAVVGHSQGGLDTRFALRFWPDTRALVADYVALGTPNHGSTGNDTNYPDGTPGPAAVLQMRTTADLIAAVNSGQETFPGIDYTTVSTVHDQYVTPATSVAVDGGTHVSLQDVCPGDVHEHVALGTVDAVAYTMVVDALTHDGPARTDRIDPDVCGLDLMPGVDPATVEENLAAVNEAIAVTFAAAPRPGPSRR